MSKRNVSYVAQEEPNFLKQFKQRIGYKEEPGIDAKRRIPAEGHFEDDDDDDDERCEPEEEKPQVVILKAGDLTAEEADKFRAKKDEDAAITDQKIVFKMPEKRSAEETSIFKSSSTKRTKTSSINPSLDSEKHKTDSGKKISNAKLLSFNEEEEDDDE